MSPRQLQKIILNTILTLAQHILEWKISEYATNYLIVEVLSPRYLHACQRQTKNHNVIISYDFFLGFARVRYYLPVQQLHPQVQVFGAAFFLLTFLAGFFSAMIA
jgi:hypothetical protein